ncbi:uncharacterized membrane protein YhaH (DUF805 family) [Aminobacter sp. AP02]|nr:DUF805 domain-containing protein [Aminobacter sp. AP02]PWK76043.1 uncharacterized membrane protein YhaH (DUF805 family) [Aminobacter sp. AP02]
MRGEVLYYDETQGFGFIAGADGNRYAFAREDLRREMQISKGAEVEFQPSGGQARGVFSIGSQTSAPTAAPSPQLFGRMAVSSVIEKTSLWSYFWRGLTANYANFRGRARRKEYWGFYLYWAISVMLLMALGLGIDGALGNLEAGMEAPVVVLGLPGLLLLAGIVPCIAVTVRRIHDLGLSGWFYLLILLPYAGGLIILVFSLMPSQKHENKWGAVPAGVKVPPPPGA